MLKQISLIALVAIGIAAVFIGTSHAPAFAACSGNPHDTDSGPSGNPHDSVGGSQDQAGNPHDLGGRFGGEGDHCNGAK